MKFQHNENSLQILGNATVFELSNLKLKSLSRLKIDSIDCSQVEKSDSALIALILTLQSLFDQTLKVKAFPVSLSSLIPLYNLDGLIEFVD